MKGPCVLKPVFLWKNINEPVIKYGQSEKQASLRCKLQSLLRLSITVPCIKRKTSARGGRIYKVGLRIAYLTTSTI